LNKPYLKGRYQKAALVNLTDSSKSSKWEEIKNGVTQGSILGPSFFLFDIKRLAKNKKIRIPIWYSLQTIPAFLDIQTWFKDNLLSLNFNKTQYLEF